MKILFFVLFSVVASLAQAAQPMPGTAIIWSGTVLDADPRVDNIQCNMYWRDVEAVANVFTWGPINTCLNNAAARQKPTMININVTAGQDISTKPTWMTWDWWSPVHIAEYRQLLQNFAAYFNIHPNKSWALGYRLQPNCTTGTEFCNGNNAARAGYLRSVFKVHEDYIHSVGLATPFRVATTKVWLGATGQAEIDAYLAKPLHYAMTVGFGTAALSGPSWRMSDYIEMKRTLRNAGSIKWGYAEDKFGAWDIRSPPDNEATGSNSAQEVYWRQLLKLDTGATISGTRKREFNEWTLNNPGVGEGLSFFRKYVADWQTPSTASGAWIALMHDPMVNGTTNNTDIDNLGYFITQENLSTTVSTPISNYNPTGANPSPYQSLRVRRFLTNADFTLDPTVAAMLRTQTVRFSVEWYGSGNRWVLQYRDTAGAYRDTTSSGTKTGWHRRTFTVVNPQLAGGVGALRLVVKSGQPVLHMIELDY